MSYNYPEIKKFSGLYIQRNSFNLPDGALEQCDNCVINQDGVITKRRGFSTFLATTSATLNNLFFYQNFLVAIFDDHLAWLASNGTATTNANYTGVSVAETGGRIGRSSQSNGNLYVTSDNGILKLEAYNGTVQTAGVPPALDLQVRLLGTGVGAAQPIGGNTQVAYRITFGRTDSNNNLLESAPSDSTVIINNTGQSRATRLEFSVPSEIQDTSYFYRVYRSSQTNASTTVPAEDYQLLTQKNLTSLEVSVGVVFFDDTVLDIFQQAGALLYTNPQSNGGDGELQGNARPPLTQDVAFYKNYTLYANAINRHNLLLNLVSTSSSYFNGSSNYIEVQLGVTTIRRYLGRYGVGNSTVTATASGTGTVTISYAAHGLLNQDSVYISNVNGSVLEGTYTISFIDANTFSISSPGNTASVLDFEGIYDVTGVRIFQVVAPGGSPATGLDLTARGLVRAVNRDTLSEIYARYISSDVSVPGQMYFEAKGFGANFAFRGDGIANGAFSPPLTSSFTGSGAIVSSNDVEPHFIYVSKVGQPEAVPSTNSLPIGAKNSSILRIVPLRDCVIVIKDEGVFRIDGDTVTNFTSTILDSTVKCLVPSSVQLIDNTVMMLSNQGVVKIASSAVQIVSYEIELALRAVLGSANLVANTSAVAYESERLYLLTTLMPNTTSATTVYCYNVLSNSWTTWDTLFSNGIVGPSDTLYLITLANNIVKERKNQDKTDYCGQDYATSVVSVTSDKMSAVVSVTGAVPEAGDILVLNSVISRLAIVTAQLPNYVVTFYTPTNLTPSSTPTLYSQYASTIKFAPFHAGAIDRLKQFAEFQVHFRDQGVSIMQVTYANDQFGSSEVTNWNAYAVSSQEGWGNSPWAFFAWGLDTGIELTYTTQPAPIFRTYVPISSQRSTFIQPIIVHSTAGERMAIQGIGYAVRGYSGRTSK